MKNELDRRIIDFQSNFTVDETCLIDRTGQKRTLLALRKIASDNELSSTEEDTPSFQTAAGQVYIHYPDVSLGTHRGVWEGVFAYITPIVLADGSKPAFYHFEMPLSIFQDLIKTNNGRMYVVDPKAYPIADSGYDFSSNEGTDSESLYFPPVSAISGSAGFATLEQKIMASGEDGTDTYRDRDEVHYVAYKHTCRRLGEPSSTTCRIQRYCKTTPL